MNSGFSLIEILIVIAITGVLLTMILAYSQSSNNRIAIYVDRAKVVSVLERARSLALQKYAGDGFVCAYGVNWENNSRVYRIYSVSSSTAPCVDYNYTGNNSNVREIQSFLLHPSNKFSGGGSVYFVPPYFTTSSNATITISNVDLGFNVDIGVLGNSIVQ
jgi:prepilin-type N-terminal cleavage/methylation domain-containing protein